jgi:tetratricopeptide (TPR) repeat protein
LVLAANGAKVLRAGSDLPLSAKPGDILFAGDALRAEGGTVTFVACGANTQQGLSPDGDVLFEARFLKQRAGKVIDQKSAPGCFLPPLPRSVVAGRQDAGVVVAQEMARSVQSQTYQDRLRLLPEDKRTQLVAELQPLDQAIQANPTSPVARLARAAALEKYGLAADAAEEMRQVKAIWPDAGWVQSRLFVLQQDAAKPAVDAEPPDVEGQTYALVVGIDHFQDPGINHLDFAHDDANDLARLLETPRAGGIPADNLVLLTNKQATRAAIQGAIETNLKGRAGKNDTVLLFIASHGAAFPDAKGRYKGYIVTYDSTPEDLATTGIPMDDIRKLFEDQLGNVKRLLLFVDVCHAGQIGQVIVNPARTNVSATSLATVELQYVFGMLAAQKGQVALEGTNFGGGHGAFTYFLMRALNGDADLNHDGKVSVDELYHYVTDKVQEATASRQEPDKVGQTDDPRALARVDRPGGIDLPDYTKVVLTASRSITRPTTSAVSMSLAPESFATVRTLKYQNAAKLVEQYEKAIADGRILNTEDQGAFTFLAALKVVLLPKDYALEAELLRVALEDKGQQVLLTYLAGEREPQKKEDFERGAAYFEAAELLAPDSLYLQSRRIFCRGRAAIFDKDYTRASSLLERAIGLDSERGYSYNALGISYLERANYDLAIAAFKDASRRAPYWAYPLHNMALAYGEEGDYQDAILTYQRAMRLAPRVAYLPYNLALLYQRLNRAGDAEPMYRKALEIEPGNAQALNALGTLKAAAGRRAEAEKFYKQALTSDPALLAARHDLALLVAEDSKRSDEAIALWRDNLARDPNHLPSRLGLARELAQLNRNDEAAQEYEKVVALRPEYVVARLALADVYTKAAKPQEALAQLDQALKVQPDNAAILEKSAQAYVALNRTADARSAYQKALKVSPDGATRKRIRVALRKLG